MNIKSSTARLSIYSNTALIMMNEVVGLLSGSVSIPSKAVNTLIDLIAALMAFFSIKPDSKPAYDKYPFGLGKNKNWVF